MRIKTCDYGIMFDIASMRDLECPNLFLVKSPSFDPVISIMDWEVAVGPYTFTPGETYDQIGSKEKTSAGFTWFHGHPGSELEYIGVYRHWNQKKCKSDQYLLFNKVGEPNPKPPKGYRRVYFTWLKLSKDALFTLNYTGSGRVTECPMPNPQLSLF